VSFESKTICACVDQVDNNRTAANKSFFIFYGYLKITNSNILN
jgi:hypothetical protein